MIQTADADYIRRLFIKAESGGFWTHHHHGVAPAEPTGRAHGVYVEPKVNASRWLIVCPTCGAGQLASPDFPLFFCVDCLNAEVGGQWIEVRWPSADERAAIEEVLNARPIPHTRSWENNETIGLLVVENHFHGGLVDHDNARVLGDPGQHMHGVLPTGKRKLGRGRNGLD